MKLSIEAVVWEWPTEKLLWKIRDKSKKNTCDRGLCCNLVVLKSLSLRMLEKFQPFEKCFYNESSFCGYILLISADLYGISWFFHRDFLFFFSCLMFFKKQLLIDIIFSELPWLISALCYFLVDMCLVFQKKSKKFVSFFVFVLK